MLQFDRRTNKFAALKLIASSNVSCQVRFFQNCRYRVNFEFAVCTLEVSQCILKCKGMDVNKQHLGHCTLFCFNLEKNAADGTEIMP